MVKVGVAHWITFSNEQLRAAHGGQPQAVVYFGALKSIGKRQSVIQLKRKAILETGGAHSVLCLKAYWSVRRGQHGRQQNKPDSLDKRVLRRRKALNCRGALLKHQKCRRRTNAHFDLDAEHLLADRIL